MTFKELNLIGPLLRAIEQEGYTEPSPIQEQSIPLLINGRDLLGCAQTGTGKTAAFALPILQKLYEQREGNGGKHPLRALVLTPTRELAAQVGESFKTYGRFTGIKTTVIFGGVGQEPQVTALRRGVDVLVATPGRLNDLIGQGLCSLSGISYFVLDEADRMLDMGFIHDVKKIIALLPKERQTLLFSATMPQEIADLADSMLRNPETVAVTPVSSAVEVIEQSVYLVDKANKRHLLVDLLRDESIVSALVFSRTKHGADRIKKILASAGVAAGAIHGDKSQGARITALADFKEGRTRVLIATDIAARGIDIDQLSHVINYDLPNEPETYVHRIGRTGRAGLGGTAISFCDFDEKAYLKDIEKLIGKTIPIVDGHAYPMEVFTPYVKPPRPPRPTDKPDLRANAPKNKLLPPEISATKQRSQLQAQSKSTRRGSQEAPARAERPSAPSRFSAPRPRPTAQPKALDFASWDAAQSPVEPFNAWDDETAPQSEPRRQSKPPRSAPQPRRENDATRAKSLSQRDAEQPKTPPQSQRTPAPRPERVEGVRGSDFRPKTQVLPSGEQSEQSAKSPSRRRRRSR